MSYLVIVSWLLVILFNFPDHSADSPPSLRDITKNVRNQQQNN